LLLAAVGLIVLAIVTALFYWLIGLVEGIDWMKGLLFYVGNFYTGLVVTWVLLFVDGLITLIIATLLWPARLLVILGRWFMWRVSSYPKGPVAALTAVVGTILAVVRFTIK
jgi:hypothetical protein